MKSKRVRVYLTLNVEAVEFLNICAKDNNTSRNKLLNHLLGAVAKKSIPIDREF